MNVDLQAAIDRHCTGAVMYLLSGMKVCGFPHPPYDDIPSVRPPLVLQNSSKNGMAATMPCAGLDTSVACSMSGLIRRSISGFTPHT